MLTTLTILIVIVSIFQKDIKDIKSCTIFCIPMLILWLISDFTNGLLYYLLNSYFAFISIYLLSQINNQLSYKLSIALFISILLNLFGYISWFFYMQPTVYHVSFCLWYLWIFYLILKKGSFKWTRFHLFGASSRSLQSFLLHMKGSKG